MRALIDMLFEQAYKRKVAIDQIRHLVRPIVLHLIKILKWDDQIDFSKHTHDISQWLFDVQLEKVKSGRGRLSASEYFDLLYDEPIGDDVSIVGDFIGRKLRKYKNNHVLRSDDDVMREMKRILKEVSKDISMNKFEGIEGYLK